MVERMKHSHQDCGAPDRRTRYGNVERYIPKNGNNRCRSLGMIFWNEIRDFGLLILNSFYLLQFSVKKKNWPILQCWIYL